MNEQASKSKIRIQRLSLYKASLIKTSIKMDSPRRNIKTCVCDCHSIDHFVDNLLQSKLFPTAILDRLFGSLMRKGSSTVTKVRLDIILPALVVPFCLCIATIGPFSTVLSFMFMPLFLILMHGMWRRHGLGNRNKIFYSWGQSSIATSYLVFQCFVVVFREVLLWEILLIFTLTLIIFHLLKLMKKDYSEATGRHPNTTYTHKRYPSSTVTLYDQVSGEKREVNLDYDDSPQTQEITVPLTENHFNLTRSGYCPVCDAWIPVRDHHCVWLDCCIGGSNHRAFMLAMVTFIITAIYGSHLTLTTVCTPKMYFEYFLLPNDCRWLYIDFLTAICFVTAVYSLISAAIMILNLIYHSILISQNLTSLELHNAATEGRVWFGVLVPSHPLNHGLLHNWLVFWSSDHRSTRRKRIF